MGQWDLLLGSFVSQSLLSSLSPAKQKPSLMCVWGSVPAGYTRGGHEEGLSAWVPAPTGPGPVDSWPHCPPGVGHGLSIGTAFCVNTSVCPQLFMQGAPRKGEQYPGVSLKTQGPWPVPLHCHHSMEAGGDGVDQKSRQGPGVHPRAVIPACTAGQRHPPNLPHLSPCPSSWGP